MSTLSALVLQTALGILVGALTFAMVTRPERRGGLAPAWVAAIVLAEFFGWRSVFYWLGVGGGIGLIGSGITGFAGNTVDPDFWNDYGLALNLAAGFVGGLVYWLVAGRLIEPPRRPAPPNPPMESSQ